MNSRPYLVRVATGACTHDSLWPDERAFKVGADPRRPLARLERVAGDQSITLHVAGQAPRSLPVSSLSAPIEIQGHRISVVPAATLSPAYRTPSGLTGDRVVAFAGLLRSPTECEEVVSAYVGKSRGLPVFALYRTTTGFHLKPLRKGIALRFGRETPQTLEIGSTQNIPLEKIPAARITRGHAWWRFSLLGDGDSAPVSELGRLAFDDEPASDAWFHGLLLVAAAAFAVGLTLLLVRPAPESLLPKPRPPVVKFKFGRQKPPVPVAAPQPQPETAQAATAPAAPVPEPAPAPVPVPVKPAPTKAEPPAAAAHPVAPAAPAPAAKPKAPAKAVTQALSAMKSLALFGKKAQLPTTPAAKSDRTALAPTATAVAKPKVDARALQVARSDISTTTNADARTSYAGGAASQLGNPRGSSAGSLVSFDAADTIVEEGLTKEEVGAVIRSKMSEIRYCHETALADAPSLQGKVLVKFAISAMGSVVRASVLSSTLKPESNLSQCLVTRLKTWKFPKPKGGTTVEVSYPFNFRTLGTSAADGGGP